MNSKFRNGYALLIGVNENYVPDLSLPDVEKDIEALYQVLISPAFCGYPEEQVKRLIGEDATKQNILDELEGLQKAIEAHESGNATAFVYYSGHGWRDGASDRSDFYFIPYDMRAGKYRLRALRAQDFANEIEALQPDRLLVVLDCCHAEGMGVKGNKIENFASVPRLASFLPRSENSITPAGHKGLESLGVGSGRAVLTSSQSDEQSFIRKDRKMSIFTYHLIEALTGHAQPQEGATEVLVSDVMSFIYRKVPQSAISDYGRSQRPDYRVNGNFPVAMLMGGKGLSPTMSPPDPLVIAQTPPLIKKIYNAGRDLFVAERDININTINNRSTSNPETENNTKELSELITQLAATLEGVYGMNPEKADDVNAVAIASESFIHNAKEGKPNKTKLQQNGEKFKSVARNLLEFAPDMVVLATRITDLVFKLS